MTTLDQHIKEHGELPQAVPGETFDSFARRCVRHGAAIGAEWGLRQMSAAIAYVPTPLPPHPEA